MKAIFSRLDLEYLHFMTVDDVKKYTYYLNEELLKAITHRNKLHTKFLQNGFEKN